MTLRGWQIGLGLSFGIGDPLTVPTFKEWEAPGQLTGNAGAMLALENSRVAGSITALGTTSCPDNSRPAPFEIFGHQEVFA